MSPGKTRLSILASSVDKTSENCDCSREETRVVVAVTVVVATAMLLLLLQCCSSVAAAAICIAIDAIAGTKF